MLWNGIARAADHPRENEDKRKKRHSNIWGKNQIGKRLEQNWRRTHDLQEIGENFRFSREIEMKQEEKELGGSNR